MTKPSVHRTSAKPSGAGHKRLGINDRLALISLMDEGVRLGSSDSPMVADLFSELGDLVDATVSGAKIDRLKSEDAQNGFKVFEINAETGENLGRLHMLYLKKPIPCYYLVYVEVAAPFRKKGLGNRILLTFRDFLIEKSAVGILDNIIPEEEPTYDIYMKLDWKPVEEITGTPAIDGESQYMVFVPPSLAERDLRDAVLKLVHHLKRKRPTIDMRDNELMVRRTIDEFKELYAALLKYFEMGIRRGENDSFMRFMFTRFVTKYLGFRRRISQLVGYTGGESLEQIVLDSEIRALPVQSYAPRDLAGNPSFQTGDKELWLHLPEVLKKFPARIIESLPNYRRPNLVSWLKEKGISPTYTLTIGDLLNLGFDPTRLKEITIEGKDFIFERLQARMLPHLERRKELLNDLTAEMGGVRLRNAALHVNLPLLVIRDRGNGYVLRRKIAGIHWEEAVEQLQTAPALKDLNASMAIDRMTRATVRKTQDWLKSRLNKEDEFLLDQFTYFVSWNLEANQPKLVVDFSGTYLESIWVA
ncbi:MAG: hypothetical protein ACLP5H_18695 [Desulfomonilaceae bacterium]